MRGVQARVNQAYASRRQTLYEKESTLALDLAKADAMRRLAIRAKLQTLALDGRTRRGLQAQLAAIQAREDAIVARRRQADRAVLAAYLPPLEARAASDIRRMRTNLQNRTAANLAARERVLAAQNAPAPALNLGAVAQRGNDAGNMRGRLDALLHAQPADPDAFLAAKSDLSAQFGSVAGADNAATRSTWRQIAALEAERSNLYREIVSQIMRDAESLARARGLGRVYAAHAPAGSVDITAAVRSDFVALAK